MSLLFLLVKPDFWGVFDKTDNHFDHFEDLPNKRTEENTPKRFAATTMKHLTNMSGT